MNDQQKEEIAKYCFDLSKLALGSWVLGVFAPEIEVLSRVLFGVAGLTFAILFFILGVRLLKEM